MFKLIAIASALIVCALLLTTAIAFVELGRSVEMSGGWHNWFSDIVNKGWFAFILIRVGVFVLLLFVVGLVSRRSRFAGQIAAAALIVGLVVFLFITSHYPAGVYAVVDKIEGDGEDYFVFAGGKETYVHSRIYLIMGEKTDGGQDEHVQVGHYEKTADGWILTQVNNDNSHYTYKMKPSWLVIWLIDMDVPESRVVLGRRILPFLRPDWMPNWLQ